MGYDHIEVERSGHIATIWLNRPDKLNAMSEDIWADIPKAMAELEGDETVRVVILAGRGRAFTVGIDIEMLASLLPTEASQTQSDKGLYDQIKRLQLTATSLAKSPKPVIAAIHGHCLGGGMGLITACDIRYGSEGSVFSIRETRLAVVADVGTLQRLPAIVGAGHTAELAFTGADIDAARALEIGLLDGLYPDPAMTYDAAQDLASMIAENSPLVVQGIKRVLGANNGRSTAEALDYVARWNADHLLSNDLMEAIAAFLAKRPPEFTGS